MFISIPPYLDAGGAASHTKQESPPGHNRRAPVLCYPSPWRPFCARLFVGLCMEHHTTSPLTKQEKAAKRHKQRDQASHT